MHHIPATSRTHNIGFKPERPITKSSVDRGWTFPHRFGIEYYMTYISRCTWNWMCNGFKNAREHYTVGIYYIYYIITLLRVDISAIGCTRLDLYSHKTHCVISNPYDCSDISCSAETLIFRLAMYRKTTCLPTVWQWRRRRRFGFPGRSCFCAYDERLPASSSTMRPAGIRGGAI